MVRMNGGKNLFGPEMLENPFPVYHALRAADPVCWDPSLNVWIVTRHADVSAVMKDSRFSSDRVSLARGRYAERHQPVFDLLSRVMLQTDAPRHNRLRNLVHNAFTRTTVENYEARIRSLCQGLLAPGVETGAMEFVSEFAAPLPILVISEIVGIPAEDRHQIKIWCDAFSTVALNFYVHLSDEQLDDCSAQIADFRAYLADKVEAARKSPGPDLISSLVLAADQDHALDIDELIANCILLLNAGNETTTCLLANGLGLLLQNPDQMTLLRAEPARIPDAIEELLRLEGPVQFLGRVATKDLAVGGRRIQAGQMVLPVLAAANRDPEIFDRPDKLDINRVRAHQLGFGTGPHQCAGIQLARFEAKIAFEELLKTVGSMSIDATTLKHTKNFNMRCLSKLPLALA